MPMELEPYFQDYRIRVFDIVFLADKVITALTDKTVLDYPAEIAELMAVFTGDKRYKDILPVVKEAKRKGERVTMCWVAQELIEKGEAHGETLMATLMQKLFADGRVEDAQRAASNECDRKKLYREYGLID